MPIFKYKATDKKGKLVTDTINATSEKEAETLLKDKNYKVLVLKEQKKRLSFHRYKNLRQVPGQRKNLYLPLPLHHDESRPALGRISQSFNQGHRK